MSFPFISFHFFSCTFISFHFLLGPLVLRCSYELLPRMFEPETLRFYLNFIDFPVALSNRTLSPSWWEARLEHLDLLRFPCCWLWSFPSILHLLSFPFTSFHFLSFLFLSCQFVSVQFLSFPFNSFPFTSLHFLSIPFPSFPFISFPFLPFHFHSDSKAHRFYCNRTFSPSWWEAHLEHSGILGFPCCWLLTFLSIYFISFHVHLFPFISIHVLPFSFHVLFFSCAHYFPSGPFVSFLYPLS